MWSLPTGILPLRKRRPPWSQQDGHFYLRLFLLSRKASNATIKLPKVNNKVKIPMKIEITSNAVIVTHLPSYVFQQAGHFLGGCHPCRRFHVSNSTIIRQQLQREMFVVRTVNNNMYYKSIYKT